MHRSSHKHHVTRSGHFLLLQLSDMLRWQRENDLQCQVMYIINHSVHTHMRACAHTHFGQLAFLICCYIVAKLALLVWIQMKDTSPAVICTSFQQMNFLTASLQDKMTVSQLHLLLYINVKTLFYQLVGTWNRFGGASWSILFGWNLSVLSYSVLAQYLCSALRLLPCFYSFKNRVSVSPVEQPHTIS